MSITLIIGGFDDRWNLVPVKNANVSHLLLPNDLAMSMIVIASDRAAGNHRATEQGILSK